MDSPKLENALISEIRLTSIQAKTFLLVTWYGKMSALQIAKKLKISLFFEPLKKMKRVALIRNAVKRRFKKG